ncbi:MAG TPA: hypothetical protein VFV17_08815, partial [Usitatibacteraceae bacterium]|nr:hypothetical protein [Usitatibacteraceae bacterium]
MNRPFRIASKRILFAAVLLLGLAPLPGLRADGLPDLGDVSDASVSEQQEKTIGRRIMQEIRADRSHVDDAELQDYIKAL